MVLIVNGWVGVSGIDGSQHRLTRGQVVARLAPPVPTTPVTSLTDVEIRVFSYREAVDLVLSLPDVARRLVGADPTLEFAKFYFRAARTRGWALETEAQ
jgi:hypothetical protein